MVRGLVAVGILSDDARDVLKVGTLLRLEGEKAVKRLAEMLLPAEERHHAAHIVEDTEAVLPCRGFGIVASGFVRVEAFAPVSVGTPSAEEP